jgi:hypothetical protein
LFFRRAWTKKVRALSSASNTRDVAARCGIEERNARMRDPIVRRQRRSGKNSNATLKHLQLDGGYVDNRTC